MLSTVYKKYSNVYEHDITHKDYYLYWIENDLLLELNDNSHLMLEINPNLQRAFPNMNSYQIVEKLKENTLEHDIHKNIEYLWSFLPNDSKDNFVNRGLSDNILNN